MCHLHQGRGPVPLSMLSPEGKEHRTAIEYWSCKTLESNMSVSDHPALVCGCWLPHNHSEKGVYS